MEENCTNYLEIIPDELKIAIFSYLKTFDVIELSKISVFEHLSFDRNLISNVILSKEYRCDLIHWNNFILNKLRSRVITSLNINCIYWISAGDLRKGVGRLQMLENFYAVDTKLGLASIDCLIYQLLPHLKTLAVTVLDRDLETNNLDGIPESIAKLCLHTELRKADCITKLSVLLSKLKFLEELWVIDLSSSRLQISSMRLLTLLPRGTLKKLTFMIQRASDLAIVNTINSSFNGIVTFKNYKNSGQVCFEKFDRPVNDIYNYWNCRDAPWETLINRLKCERPFGKKDAKKLILGQSKPETLCYEELNITHAADLCNKIFKVTSRFLLLAQNMAVLKKLSINFCLCEQSNDEFAKQSEPLFKRARVGAKYSLPSASTLEKIVLTSPLIEELELWECTSANTKLSYVTEASLGSIKHFSNLKKLTLHGIPEHSSGQFLIPICQSCEHLTSLRIMLSMGNSSFQNNLSLALPYATALKDFRYKRFNIPLNKLMETLNDATNLKLERMVLKCTTIEKFLFAPFEKFLSNNLQLRFLCIVIDGLPTTVIRNISKTLNRYKNSPEKVFIATNDESTFTGRLPIPHVHRREILNCHSSVSTLDIFNGFVEY